ncbi:MAG TPA: cupin domain-containing protein [Candidatus Acidoferrales bacterium]|nr:cupin domain-containing protein [Candidatus Acidoferrales bacterium]
MSKQPTPQQLESMVLADIGGLDVVEAAALLAEGAAPAAPAPSVKSRLMTRVAAYEQVKPIADVRDNEPHWMPYGAPAVEVKQLFRDATTGRTTVLIRMGAGARLPAHHHHDIEQCLVIKGDVRFGELVYEEGDFVVMGKDTDHPDIHSVHGNVLLLVAGRTEFLHA